MTLLLGTYSKIQRKRLYQIVRCKIICIHVLLTVVVVVGMGNDEPLIQRSDEPVSSWTS